MKLLYSHVIRQTDIEGSYSEDSGLFTARQSDVLFFHEADHDLICDRFGADGTCERTSFPTGASLVNAKDWMLVRDGRTLVCPRLERPTYFSDTPAPDQAKTERGLFALALGEAAIGDGLRESIAPKQTTEEETAEFYARSRARREWMMHKPYIDGMDFGAYRVYLGIGERSLRCEKDGALLWKKRLAGYLYTEILPVGEGRITLGTDGEGGHFYLIDLASGQAVLDVNTGGSEKFAWDGETAYMIDRRQHALLAVSAADGAIVDSLPIPGKQLYDLNLFRHKNRIYLTSFIRKNKQDHLCMHCVEI